MSSPQQFTDNKPFGTADGVSSRNYINRSALLCTSDRKVNPITWLGRTLLIATAMLLLLICSVSATEKTAKPQTLFTNVHIFDGVNEKRIENANVLVEGSLIKTVSTDAITAEGATVIDGGGRTLMPGLTDCHWHNMQAYMGPDIFSADLGELSLVAAWGAEKTLMRGFTSVRDPGGPSFSVKKVIDSGMYKGPRIYAAGMFISQTTGHADFRKPIEVPRPLSRDLTPQEEMGFVAYADGKEQVIRRVREAFLRGATFIKVMAGGGVASPSDPLDASQYTVEEIQAAVEVADSFNTYVTVHAYTSKAVQNAIRGGVRNVEHGQMIDEETAKLMAKTDTSVCLQPFYDDEDAIPFSPGSVQEAKYQELISGTDNAYALAKKYKLLAGFGTDTQNMPALAERQGAQLAKLTRYYEPWEVLRMATSENYKIFKRSGPRDPYPGENGVVKEGALADLLLVDGNPLEDIDLVADPHKNFLIIMKDGVLYKNTLQ